MGRPRAGDDALSVAVDLLFGALLPVCCLVFDPIVFSEFGDEWEGPLYEYRHAAWSGIGLMIALLVWWRLKRPYRTYVPAVLTGVFFVAALTALAFGVWLLPAAMVLLFISPYGVLALAPLGAMVVYVVNADRAYKVAKDRLGTGARPVAALGAVGTLSLALVLVAVG